MTRYSADELKSYIQQIDVASPRALNEAITLVMAAPDSESREKLAEIVAKMFDITMDELLERINQMNKPLEKVIAERIEELDQDTPSEIIKNICVDLIAIDDEIKQHKLIDRLAKRTGISKRAISKTLKKIRSELFESGADTAHSVSVETLPRTSLIQVKEKVNDAPVPEGLVMPPKYTVNERGEIVFEGDKFVEYVCPVPLFIARRFRDLDTEKRQVELVFRVRGEWLRIIVPKSTIADAGRIVQLADHDLPVSSDNARLLVRYLREFEQWNIDVLPVVEAVRWMGWREWRGRQVFVWGSQVVGADAQIHVQPESAGERQLVDALCAGGTWDGWVREVFEPASRFPTIRMAIYAALASPLLKHMGAQGFAFHVCGPSSKGKTTAAQVAMSVAGYPGGPGMADRPGLYREWDSTAVGVERLYAVLQHVPAFLDESNRARDTELVSRAVYALANRTGRQRGTLHGGLQHVATWCLTAISTGERTLTETTRLAGVRVRAIEWGRPPFQPEGGGPATSPELGRVARALRHAAATHYGHALPRLVQVVLQHGLLDQLREMYRRAVDHMVERAAEELGQVTELADRQAGLFGAIAVAAQVFHRWVLPQDHSLEQVTDEELLEWVTRQYIDYVATERPEQTHVEAYHAVMSWAAANAAAFYGSPYYNEGDRPPTGGWVGKWEVKVKGRSYLAVEPNALRRFLDSKGYPVEAVLRAWLDEGWILPTEGRRFDRKIKYGDITGWAIALVRLDSICSDSESDSETEDSVVTTTANTNGVIHHSDLQASFDELF